MLITPTIDKDLFEGKCTFKTINLGLTSTATIPIPAGGFIILRQILYYPPAVGVVNPETRPIIQLSMVENGGRAELVYVFRNNITLNYDPVLNRKWHTGGNVQTVETWQVFKKYVQVDFSITPNLAGNIYPPQTGFKDEAQERQQPLGYGSGVGNNIDSQVTLSTGQTFYPTGENRQFQSQPFNGNDRIRFDIDPTVQIPQVNGAADSGFQPVLFTFGYFEYKTAINKLI
ncbi:hypothetical protein EB001_11290 [bacterium]|nr:hypothetical protein [bacterium]